MSPKKLQFSTHPKISEERCVDEGKTDLKKYRLPPPPPPPRGILFLYFLKPMSVNRQIGRRSGITKSLCDATMAANFLVSVYPLG
jgi:hypothetical protein